MSLPDFPNEIQKMVMDQLAEDSPEDAARLGYTSKAMWSHFQATEVRQANGGRISLKGEKMAMPSNTLFVGDLTTFIRRVVQNGGVLLTTPFFKRLTQANYIVIHYTDSRNDNESATPARGANYGWHAFEFLRQMQQRGELTHLIAIHIRLFRFEAIPDMSAPGMFSLSMMRGLRVRFYTVRRKIDRLIATAVNRYIQAQCAHKSRGRRRPAWSPSGLDKPWRGGRFNRTKDFATWRSNKLLGWTSAIGTEDDFIAREIGKFYHRRATLHTKNCFWTWPN